MKRQDLNGYRTPEDVVRRYDLSKIELNSEDIEKIKQDIICDDHLSTTSKAPVQNKVVTNALNGKVSKETGKGLSTNDYTDTDKEKVSKLKDYTHINATNPGYGVLTIPLDAKEIYAYFIVNVSSTKYVFNVCHIFLDNLDNSVYYFDDKRTLFNDKIMSYQLTLSLASNIRNIYMTTVSYDGSSVIANTTLYVDYR